MTWISVKDKLPELGLDNESEPILIVEEKGYMTAARLVYFSATDYREEIYVWRERTTGCGCCCRDLYPTHWMPLPKEPYNHDITIIT